MQKIRTFAPSDAIKMSSKQPKKRTQTTPSSKSNNSAQHAWHALSPLDGRYVKIGQQLASYFSEYALMRYRVQIEIAYLIALIEHPLPELEGISTVMKNKLRHIADDFNEDAMARIKSIEQTTQHDVKAVEYYIKEQMTGDLKPYREFVHIGLTSQDINNTAIPLSLKECYEALLFPSLEGLVSQLNERAKAWKDISMLGHTHGQPATPTLLGKEVKVFATRLEKQLDVLRDVPFCAKFGGATGSMNAHVYAYPEIDWNNFAIQFINSLGLQRSAPTTQIEHYDHLASFFDALGRISTILIDYARDIWQYIAMDYLVLRAKKGEIGSSTMPHKVNPIDFENAEGNLGLARAIGRHFSEKLPISRLQRDLSDSTVLRNIGLPIGHLLLAIESLKKGTNKVTPNKVQIANDLHNNWEVIAETAQALLRKIGFPKPYEKVKEWVKEGSLEGFRNKMTKDVGAFLDEKPKKPLKN